MRAGRGTARAPGRAAWRPGGRRGPLLLLALASLAAGPLRAVDPARAATQLLQDRWDAENGLPSQAITALLQDGRGYLWAGTQDGLARFDGARFVVYGQRRSRAFHNDFVHALAETPDGAVWAGTHLGLVRVEGDSLTHYSAEQGLPAQVVTALAVTPDGTLWAGTSGGGLARQRAGGFEPVGPPLDVRALVSGPDGTLWVGTAGAGVFRVSPSAGRLEVTPMTSPGPLAGAHVAALAIGPEGALWAGTARAGLFRWRDGAVAPVPLGPPGQALDVASLRWDATGTLWVGMQGGGLWRVRGLPAAPRVERIETDDSVLALWDDRAGNLWFGTRAGGLTRLSTPLFTTVGVREGLSSATALAVLQDSHGRLWLGTVKGLNRLPDDASAVPVARAVLGASAILALCEDASGDLWVGTREGLYRCRDEVCVREDAAGVREDIQAFAQEGDVLWIGTGRGLVRRTARGSRLLTAADGLPHDRVSLLFHDREGVLWVGTEAGGLARYQDGRFERLESPEHPELAETWALSAFQDGDGSLWFGTSAGLVHLRGERVGLIRRRDGLVCDDAFTILPGQGDELWMSCNRGITSVRRADLLAFEASGEGPLRVRHYKGRAVGLAGESVGSVTPAGIRASDGRLWFPTLQGVVFLDPARASVPAPPAVVIESLQAGHERVQPPTEGLWFPPGTRHVEIAYTALELTRQDLVRFRYRLEGAEEGWTDAGGRRLALYPNLGPGRYRFRVEAALDDSGFGLSSDTVSFGIRPFLHETRAFQVALGLGLLLLALAAYRWRVRAFAARRRELESIVEHRTAELQSSAEEQRRMAERMRAMAEEMRERALSDPLTGLRNRRFLLEVLEPAHRPAREHPGGWASGQRDPTANQALAVVLMDIDHFKEVNDRHGHEAGDEVLREFAQRALAAIRPGDVAFRWGGEEFLVTLVATNPDQTAAAVERLRTAVGGRPFVLPGGAQVRLTCSAGYAAQPFWLVDGPEIGLWDLIALADLGLYAAKRAGRDQSVGVAPGSRRGVDAQLLRRALASLDEALAEGVVTLTGVRRD